MLLVMVASFQLQEIQVICIFAKYGCMHNYYTMHYTYTYIYYTYWLQSN